MSNSNQIDDGLTDEERAALASDDDTAAASETAAPDTDQAAATTEPAAATTEPAAAATTTEEAPAATQSAPILVAAPPEDIAGKLTDLETKKELLLTQFDEGDITAKEYQKQLDALAKEERALERQQDRAELAAQMEQQRLQNDWTATCNSFVDANPVYKDNPRLYKALDAEVRELAARPESANWSGVKFLEEAHKNLKAAFNLPDAGKVPKQDRQRIERELPPNLARVPSAEVEDTNGGRFAVLDRLANTDPLKYEETLNSMSDAERQAYLNAA
jgi:chromosome segregation ATPase